MDKKKIVVICGPTASGKTALSIEMAKRFDGEIISADSMQIYKHFSIATAKPTADEMDGIPHYMMDFLEPTEEFSVAEYVRLARQHINDIISRGKLPIIAGGTGLYINSLVDNISFDDTTSNKEFRDEMMIIASEKGNNHLHSLLRVIDPETAEKVHENNLPRVIRALEIYKFKGIKMSEVQKESRNIPSEYDPYFLMIDYEDRARLYDRVNRRVDLMVKQGLVEEARQFFSHPEYATASQAIGYKELFPYIVGEKTLGECLDKLKQETRHYAKRQLTWFRRDIRINRIEVNENTTKEEIFKIAEKNIALFRKV